MNFNIDKFFTGVIDLFGILIPGAFLTYFFMGKVQAYLMGADKIFPEIPTGYGAVAFAIAAYVIGHAVNGIGGWILDTYYYDRGARFSYTKKKFDMPFLTAREIRDHYLQTDRLKKGLYLNFPIISGLYAPEFKKLKKSKKSGMLQTFISNVARKIFKDYYEYKRLAGPLESIREGEEAEQFFVRDKKLGVIYTYQWCKRIFSIHKMEAMAEVNRAEADQKFFRSLVVATLIVAFWVVGEG